jgi:transcriptional regulator with XRE-family HTH domain
VYLPEPGNQRGNPTLGEALSEEIEHRGISQGEAGDQLGVPQQTISRWIRGARPDPEYHGPLAEFLGWSLDEFKLACPTSQRGRLRHADTRDQLGAIRPEVSLSSSPGLTNEKEPAEDSKSQTKAEFVRVFLKRWDDGPLPDPVVTGVFHYLFQE